METLFRAEREYKGTNKNRPSYKAQTRNQPDNRAWSQTGHSF
jgi:hypothetical protein